jgi:DNA polymerase-1
MKRLFLIDGHALIFRSYYAFLRRPMINSRGADTSILFGFTKTLIEILLKEKPTHLGVAFDPPAKTFRHELYSEYKANRSETPELIKEALVPLTEILESISVPVLMKEGFEADDVIGTIAKKASNKGFTVYMVTPDKDYGQLVSENIFQYKPGKNGGETELIGRDEICNNYGISNPTSVVDILTIWGDASDNVPGVKGIGEIGSKKLIQKYGTLENIYASLDELPQKQQAAFSEAKEQIALSRRLVTIDTNVDIPWEEDDLKLETPHFERLRELFSHYEFGSLNRMLPRLEEIFILTNESPEHKQVSGNNKESESDIYSFKPAEKDEIIDTALKNKEISLRRSGDSFVFSSGNLVHRCSSLELMSFKILLENENIIKCGYDLKSSIRTFAENNIKTKGYLADIELMHYILMPERAHKIEILASAYLNINLENGEKSIQKELFTDDSPLSPDADTRDLKEAVILIPLYHKLKEELKASSQTELYDRLEMPLVYILASMERIGVKIDVNLLNEYGKHLSAELAGIEEQIRDIAGEGSLNVSSPKQLAVLLYEKLNLTAKSKTSSGKNYSTDEETLLELSHLHPVIPLILEFRNIKKLLSTYVEPLPTLVSSVTGKIHTTYNQALTATGRLSSVKPNLQNIPVRTERGREIRRAFVASDPEGFILSADYSQIELRLMAHMSGDKDFIEAFRSGKDIHSATASKIFGVPEELLSREQRNRAKVANFGIIYGISAFGLSQRLQISRQESKKLIEDYFSNYPGVKDYISRMIEFARKNGYVETLYGRKRYLPDISSRNSVVRGLAERNAVNAPIQGSAADIIKAAMIKVYGRMEREGLKSKMVLQVHDELLFDVAPKEIIPLKDLVKKEMENVIELSVPLTVECQWGADWLEAH